MASSRTPGKALRDILNVNTPYEPTGKKGVARSKLDDRTVDLGALLRGKQPGSMLVPKLVPKLRTGQQENLPETGPKGSPVMVQHNACYSPDDSLAAAASKLRNLRATTRLAAQPDSHPAPRAATVAAAAAPLVAQQSTGPTPAAAPAEEAAAVPEMASPPPQRGEGRGERSVPGSPEYRPELECGASGDAGADLPLAARSAVVKRHRRKSQHHGPQRFGDWFSGDDDQLESALLEYNRAQEAAAAVAAEPRMTRARRKSLAGLPALGRSLTAEGESLAAALEKGAPEEKQGAAVAEDVAAQVQAITSELCSRLDGLIEGSPKEKGRKRKTEDDRSLQEKLVEAWDGKSYYERLKQMADKEEEQAGAKEGQQEQEQQPRAAQPAEVAEAAAGRRPPMLKLDLPLSSSAPSSRGGAAKTPGRARRTQQLNELTESLKKLQVAGANRTSKAAAALAGRVRSASNSRTVSPMAGAQVGSAFEAALAAGAEEKEVGEAKVEQRKLEGAVTAAEPAPAPTAVAAATVGPSPTKAAPAVPTATLAAALAGVEAKAAVSRQASPAGPKQQQAAAAPQPSGRVTRAKSKSPEPEAQPPSMQQEPAGHKAAATDGGLRGSEDGAAAAREAELKAELEATKKAMSAALKGKKAAEEQAKDLQDQLLAERHAKKAAHQHAEELASALKREQKAVKTAEKKAKELAGQVEELLKRMAQVESLERTLSRVAEKAQESVARQTAAEAQVAELLKAAGELQQSLGQVKEGTSSLQALAASELAASELASAAARRVQAQLQHYAGVEPRLRPDRQQPGRQAGPTWR